MGRIFRWLGYNIVYFENLSKSDFCGDGLLKEEYETIIVENLFFSIENLRGFVWIFYLFVFVLFVTFLYIVLTMPSHSTHRPKGSDCGIVNVNIPTSGAEIGGAFGM